MIGFGQDQKSPKVDFIALSEIFYNIFERPKPAVNFIPSWYKNLNSNLHNNPYENIDKETGNTSRTVKACMPVFDAMTAGYIMTNQAEIYFSENQNDIAPVASWSIDNFKPIDFHSVEQYSTFDLPQNLYKNAIKFINPWIIKTPPGYSCLFVHPFLRDDLPHQIIPAIVDTDKHPIPINFPAFLNKDFKGIMPIGMPIVQIIPFKREDWNSTHEFYNSSMSSDDVWQFAKRKIHNRYKSFYRTKKNWA
jgi:hypothetical protein